MLFFFYFVCRSGADRRAGCRERGGMSDARHCGAVLRGCCAVYIGRSVCMLICCVMRISLHDASAYSCYGYANLAKKNIISCRLRLFKSYMPMVYLRGCTYMIVVNRCPDGHLSDFLVLPVTPTLRSGVTGYY